MGENAAQQLEPTPLEAALVYAARGWRVFPLQPNSKIPFAKTRGVHDATTDEATIRAWWARWPKANVAIAGGNGLVILDEDTYKGGDAGALLLPITLTAHTARGGYHRYFAYEGQLGNAVEGKLLPGVGFRGDGYYVVAPPSTFTGNPYTWEDEAQPVARLPERIATMIREQRTTYSDGNVSPREGDETAVGDMPLARDPHDWSDANVWVDRAVARVRQGFGRNDTGLWLAQQLHWNDCGDLEGAMMAYQATVEWSGEHAYTEREALATLAQVVRNPRREPAGRSSRVGTKPDSTGSSPRLTYVGPAPAQDGAGSQRRQGNLDDDSGQERASRFTLLRDGDLIDTPPPEWLVSGVVTAGELAVVYGAYASGKSFLVLDLARSIASGRAWNGHKVKQGSVVYMTGEGKRALGKRIRAWNAYHLGAQKLAEDLPFYSIPTVPHLLRGDDVEMLKRTLDGIGEPPVAIVIDTLSRALVGGDENSQKDMGLAVHHADYLRAAFEASVILVHHTGKEQEGRRQASMRGSTVLPGAADSSLNVSMFGRTVTVAGEKQKDGEKLAPIEFELRVINLGEDYYGETSCVLVPRSSASSSGGQALTSKAERLYRMLAGCMSGATYSEWWGMAQLAGFSESTFKYNVKSLYEQARIEKADDRWHAVRPKDKAN